MTIELIGTLAMIAAIGGVLCNNRRLIVCFPIFLFSNFLSFIVHHQTAVNSLMVRDAVFFVLAIHGWVAWSKKSGRPLK
jgi:nicotinamide riboside transporter PnuC